MYVFFLIQINTYVDHTLMLILGPAFFCIPILITSLCLVLHMSLKLNSWYDLHCIGSNWTKVNAYFLPKEPLWKLKVTTTTVITTIFNVLC